MKNQLKKRKLRNAVIIALLFFVFFSGLSVLKNKYGPKNRKPRRSERDVEINISRGKPVVNPLPAQWKFCEGDNKAWAGKTFNDGSWGKVPLQLKVNTTAFKGIGWFRCTFKIDTLLLNKIIGFRLEHLGASEIYLDGKLIDGFGTVSASPLQEETCRPMEPVLFSIHDTLEHTLAIRYSNHSWLRNYKKYDEPYAGISIDFYVYDSNYFNDTSATDEILFWFVILFGFFITLSIVHFLIYIFYRKQVQNLYYSIFVFVFSLLALSPCFYVKLSSPPEWLAFQKNMIFVFVLFFLSIIACLHSLFKPRLWKKMFIVELLLCVVTILVHFTGLLDVAEGILILALVLFAIIESVRTVISGIKKGYPGSGIIGTGVFIFFLFISLLFIDAYVTENIGLTKDTSVYLITLVFISIISIPLSMSIYLARNFALTNNNLQNKLLEVEELSARSIEQEKEKQQILENQNITLENQVTERTFEITEQKKIIEEKNKDIIDSINYAKRIQSAMLPEEEEFKTIFSDSFVLYQPRDIVSGDFYYAAEVNGNKLVIAADCTGHGVPGALMSMVGCNIINKLTHENKISDPKTLLETLHTELRHALKQDLKGSVNRDGMDASAILITNNEIIYAGANRPLICFNQQDQLLELKPTKIPIGGSHNETISVEQQRLGKAGIKQIFLFSDGFADQFGGPDGKKLMVSKFKQWLSQVISLSAGEQQSFLSNHFKAWKKETEQVDDVMVIGIKI